MIGIALERGEITGVDQKILDFFPEFPVRKGHELLRQVTLKHCLTMTVPYRFRFNPYTKYFTSDDWVSFALNQIGGREPLGKFRYAPVSYTHLRFNEDLALMEGMGFQAFRTSISWARIFPNGDETEPNEAGLRYYDELFAQMRRRGMEPVITLSHYEMPLHLLTEYGGWLNPKMIDFWMKYVDIVFRRYHNVVNYWMTFNEVNNLFRIPFVAGGVLDIHPAHSCV